MAALAPKYRPGCGGLGQPLRGTYARDGLCMFACMRRTDDEKVAKMSELCQGWAEGDKLTVKTQGDENQQASQIRAPVVILKRARVAD